ncbi:MAG: hypothetical protein AMXMBFR4_20740 [Candidatus Hydrogenedentota bacterium]
MGAMGLRLSWAEPVSRPLLSNNPANANIPNPCPVLRRKSRREQKHGAGMAWRWGSMRLFIVGIHPRVFSVEQDFLVDVLG